MWEEFKKFAFKGNMIDMAVGIVIGAAFGKVIASLVNDILMPPIGVLLGGVNFTDLAITLKAAHGDVPAVLWRYGAFVQNLIDFLIIAFSIFLLVKAINAMQKEEEETAPAPPPTPSPEVQLLEEIRDLLKEGK